MSVFVWEHVDLKTKGIDSSDKIILVSKKIQSPNGVGIRSVSSSHTSTLVCCQDGSVQFSTHGSEHSATESILRNLAHVRSLQSQNVIQVAAGASHNVVLTEDQRVYTWGQLGQKASRKDRGRPKLVKSLASHCVLQISCGSGHTLALSDDGLVFAWGSNSFGQLGLGENMSQQNHPVIIPNLKGIPVMLLAAGNDHSFLLSKSGSVYGWGRNDYGQLGLNNTEKSNSPMKCRHFNDKNVKYICCGENHTACLTKDGSVYTFGAGSHGQLGHCSSSNETTPKQVKQLSGCEVSQIACGSNHTLAYVPQSGGLHIFGFGGSGCFSVMEEEYENCHISLSGYFVQIGDNQSQTLCLPIDNQNHHRRIKTIHAGGNHSFITVVGAKETCDADDFRNEDPSKQILTLTQEKISMLDSLNPGATQSNEIQKIFSSASCLNGSFLLLNDEHCGNSSENHGVDMNAVEKFFKKCANNQNIMKCIYNKIEKNLIPQLHPSSPDGEAIRLYLMLPVCDLFDKPEFHSSLICQFAKSFLDLDGKARNIFSSWCSCNQPSFFTHFVVIFKQCAQYLLQLPYSANTKADVKRNEDLLTCLNMLKVLHQANEMKHKIPASTFIVPELKDMVDVQKEYIRLHVSQLPEPQAQKFIQLVMCLLPSLNLDVVGEESERNDVFLEYFNMFPMLSQDLNFCNYPFLFDGEKKSILFQTETKLQMLSVQVLELATKTMFHLLLNRDYFYYYLFVDRQNIVNDTFSNLSSTDTTNLKKPFRVLFEGEKATGVGVRKEFFRLFFQEVMGPAFGFFIADDKSTLMWFNNKLQQEVEQSRQIQQFRLIGILCGLVIYNSVAIDFHFPLAIYKKLLKKPVNLDDVKELMPVAGSSLQEILNYDGDDFEDLYCLTFEYAGKELCPGGTDRTVTQRDKKVYVNLAVDLLLNKTVKAQFDAFSEGFHSACGGKILNIFQPEELRSLVEGNEDYDFTVLEKNTTYIDYHRKDPTIILFWEVFHELSLADKKKFLLFLTGSDRIPITGMKDLKIQIQPREDGMLPFAYTCTKRLCLPHYETKEQLQNNLLATIPQTEGFYTFNTDETTLQLGF